MPEQGNAITQQDLLQLFKQQGQSPDIKLNQGLLSGDQKGFMDVLKNPDQAQVNGLIGAAAGALNPRGRDPALMGIAQGAQAFQGTRQQEFDNKIQAEELRQDQLKNRLQGALGIAGFGQREDTNALAKDKFEKTGLTAEARAVEDQLADRNRVKVEQFMDQNTGELHTLNIGDDGRYYDPESGEAVDPSPLGLVPYARENNDESYLNEFRDSDFSDPTNLAKIHKASILNGDTQTANVVAKMQEKLEAENAGVNPVDMNKAANAVNPQYVKEDNLFQLSQQLKIMLEQEGAGVQALQDRFTSSLAPNNIKAASELARFSAAKSLPRRVEDSLSKFISGRHSEATKVDYRNLANAMQDFYIGQKLRTADSLEAMGGPKNKAYAGALRRIVKSFNIEPENTAGFVEHGGGGLSQAEKDEMAVLEARLEGK